MWMKPAHYLAVRVQGGLNDYLQERFCCGLGPAITGAGMGRPSRHRSNILNAAGTLFPRARGMRRQGSTIFICKQSMPRKCSPLSLLSQGKRAVRRGGRATSRWRGVRKPCGTRVKSTDRQPRSMRGLRRLDGRRGWKPWHSKEAARWPQRCWKQRRQSARMARRPNSAFNQWTAEIRHPSLRPGSRMQ